MVKRFFILSIAVFLTVPVVASAAQNLLPNASFEEPQGGIGEDPADWWSWNSEYNGITTDAKKTGKQGIYFNSYSKADEHGGIITTYKDVKPGKAYTFSCYVINSITDPMIGGAFGQLSIEWRSGDKEIARDWGPTYGAALSSSECNLETMTSTAPTDADSCNFVIQFFNKDGQGSYYADDASVEEK